MSLNSNVVDANGRRTEVLGDGRGRATRLPPRRRDRRGLRLPRAARRPLPRLPPAACRATAGPSSSRRRRNHDDVTAYLTAVVDALGLDGFVLVGHSLGGWRAVAFTAAHPERVSRLVLGAPFGMDVPGHPMIKMGEHTLEERKKILTSTRRSGRGGSPPSPTTSSSRCAPGSRASWPASCRARSIPRCRSGSATISRDLHVRPDLG